MTLKHNEGFCVLGCLVTRLIYHVEDKFLDKLGICTSETKREPVTALTLSALLGASLVRIGTGTASLITQNQHYFNL